MLKTNRRSNGAIDADQNRPAAARGAANSPFAEAQGNVHFANAGYTNITVMAQHTEGVWHGNAMRDGKATPASVNYQGSVTGR